MGGEDAPNHSDADLGSADNSINFSDMLLPGGSDAAANSNDAAMVSNRNRFCFILPLSQCRLSMGIISMARKILFKSVMESEFSSWLILNCLTS